MSHSFKVKVNESYDFTYSQEEINNLDLIRKSNSQYHILQNKQSFTASVLANDFNSKSYTVMVNGNTYEVSISNEIDQLITKLGLEASSSKKANDVKAPMPGLIVSVDITPGQEVKESDGILVLEAMKMENTLTAPKDGIVKSISVKTGDKVEKNALLIEME